MEIKFVGRLNDILFIGSPDTCSYSYYTDAKNYEDLFNKSPSKNGNFKHVVGESLEQISKLVRGQIKHQIKSKGFKFFDFKFSVVYEKVEENSFYLPQMLGQQNWYEVSDEKNS